MSELLMLIYLGEVVTALSATFFFIGILAAAMFGVASAYCRIERKEPSKVFERLVIVGILAIFVSAALPSRQFFYIAAGGTAAVRALDSEIGKKVQVLINQKLDEVIKPEPKK